MNHYTPYDTGEEHTREQIKDVPYPALSRMDNRTYICSACGTAEAMRDFTGAGPIPPSEWPVAGGE
jgi:hypothetical protein